MADETGPVPALNGNSSQDFRSLMALEKLGDWAYRSIAKPFSPAASTVAFGGHVFAQAVYAASKTVKHGMVCCNVTGFFTRAANTQIPFVYHVRAIMDGGRFCTRTVEVTQPTGDRRICFTCTATFKLAEEDNLNVQERFDARQKYRAALQDKRPEDHPASPGIDTPWFYETMAREGWHHNPVFPGLHFTKVDMSPYNDPLPPLDRRQLQYYSVTGTMPLVREDPNLHACAHLYASDRSSLFSSSNMLGVGNGYTHMASIAHTVILHVNPEEMDCFNRRSGDRKWFCLEAWTPRNGVGRVVHENRVWDDEGRHVATSMQDGLLRLGAGERKEKMRDDFEKVMQARRAKEKL